MNGEFLEGRKILERMNEIIKQILDLWLDAGKEYVQKKKFDKTKLQKILALLDELKRLKKKFLDVFKCKSLYEWLEDIDELIMKANNLAKALDKNIPKEMKKILRNMIETILKLIAEKKTKLEKALKKQLGDGPWTEACHYMNKFLDGLFKHKYVEDPGMSGKELSSYIVALHKFKMFIIMDLPYMIGSHHFHWWYRRLGLLDNKIFLLKSGFQRVKSESDYITYVDMYALINEIKKLKEELERHIPKVG